MSKSILCGSACVKYILNMQGKKTKFFSSRMIWASQLAICLKKNNIDVKVLCFNSNLYSHYKYNKNILFGFEGFKFISKCIKMGISIREVELTEKELFDEVNGNEYIILCVQSGKFNNNDMVGGHFVILNGMIDNKIKVINPIKDKYEYRTEFIKDIIEYCGEYGSWRILIKGDKND